MRPISVSGMLKILGVSRSGYNTWLKRLPSNQKKRKEEIQDNTKDLRWIETELWSSQNNRRTSQKR